MHRLALFNQFGHDGRASVKFLVRRCAIHFGDEFIELGMVRRAKAYIAGHQADPLRPENVANAMHVSTFYFCKLFKKATRLTFTDYLDRVRVEKAKALLLNPHLRVTEIAYAVGFQSLTHFNRVFRKLTEIGLELILERTVCSHDG